MFKGPGKPSGVRPFEDPSDEAVVPPEFDVFDPADGVSRVPVAVPGDGDDVGVALPGDGEGIGVALPGDGEGVGVALAVDGEGVGVALPGDGEGVGVALPVDGEGVGVALPGGKKPITVTCRVLEAIALMGPVVTRPIST